MGAGEDALRTLTRRARRVVYFARDATRSVVREPQLAAELVAVRIAGPWLMRRQSLPTVLSRLTPSKAQRDWSVEAVERASGVWLRDAPRPLCTTCFFRSLACYRALRSAGHPAVIKLGVRAGEKPLRGHAWLELGGRVIFEQEEPNYTVTFVYPQDGA